MKTTNLLIATFVLFFTSNLSAQWQTFNIKAVASIGAIDVPHEKFNKFNHSHFFNVGIGKRWSKHFEATIDLDYCSYSNSVTQIRGISEEFGGEAFFQEWFVDAEYSGRLLGLSAGVIFHFPVDEFDFSLNLRPGITFVSLKQYLLTESFDPFGSTAFIEDYFKFQHKIFPSLTVNPQVSYWISDNWSIIASVSYARIRTNKQVRTIAKQELGNTFDLPDSAGFYLNTERTNVGRIIRDYGIFTLGLGIKYAIY